MHLANQSHVADLLGVVTPVSSREIGNSRNLKRSPATEDVDIQDLLRVR